MPIIAKQIERDDKQERLYRIRHSTAHLMAHAVQELWPGVKLAFGPPLQDGFYYDFDLEHKFTADDLEKIEAEMTKVIKENQAFRRKEVSRDEAIEIIKGRGQEAYKLGRLDDIPEGELLADATPAST